MLNCGFVLVSNEETLLIGVESSTLLFFFGVCKKGRRIVIKCLKIYIILEFGTVVQKTLFEHAFAISNLVFRPSSAATLSKFLKFANFKLVFGVVVKRRRFALNVSRHHFYLFPSFFRLNHHGKISSKRFFVKFKIFFLLFLRIFAILVSL